MEITCYLEINVLSKLLTHLYLCVIDIIMF